jgi:hypothetical protein
LWHHHVSWSGIDVHVDFTHATREAFWTQAQI